MKHKPKITIILLSMFILTQFIGLYVVNSYSTEKIVEGVKVEVSAPSLPYGMETPEIQREQDFYTLFPSLIMAFVIAIFIMFLLTRFKVKFFLKLWFFVVVAIALGISFNSFLTPFQYSSIIAAVLALPLAFIKIFKRTFLVHNLTELFIYPGIAAVFVPLLNFWTVVILLVLISIYDIWAVWHSGFMQKMAKFQINELNIFSGFFLPHLSKIQRVKIKNMKKSELKKKKFKVNIAILGGGDVIFPIITAGVMLKTFGLSSAFFVLAGATLGLRYLFVKSEKKKFYPAMPFITAGIFIGMILFYLLYFLI